MDQFSLVVLLTSGLILFVTAISLIHWLQLFNEYYEDLQHTRNVLMLRAYPIEPYMEDTWTTQPIRQNLLQPGYNGYSLSLQSLYSLELHQ